MNVFKVVIGNDNKKKPTKPKAPATKIRIAVSKKIKIDPAFWTKTSLIQLFYGIWVNMSQLAIGLALGLPAVQLAQLTDPDSKIQITRDEASWIASVLTLFSPIGCLLSGYLQDSYGRRFMLVASQAPMCLGWLYTGFAKTAEQIIIGRAITGVGCGMAMGPPRIFITEISLPNMRGMLGALSTLTISLGISIQAGLGQFCSWKMLCYISCTFTCLNFILFNLLPETPYYILKTEATEKARKSLTRFRSPSYNVDREMSSLIEYKMDNDIRNLTKWETVKTLFTRASCVPFWMINIYILITQCSGTTCILMWTPEILANARSSLDVEVGNFLMALSKLVGIATTSILLFSVGRKPLALTSAIGVSFTSLCIAFYIRYSDDISIIPQLCFMAYMAFASLGYYTLPFLMASELYPLQIRGTLNGITVSVTSLLIFGSTKVFATMIDNIGLAYTMVAFGVSSLLGAIYIYLFLPETKELTLQEIEEFFSSRRSTLISQRRLLSLQLQQSSSSKSNEDLKNERTASDASTHDSRKRISWRGQGSEESEPSNKKTKTEAKDTVKAAVSSTVSIRKPLRNPGLLNIKDDLKKRKLKVVKDFVTGKNKENKTEEPETVKKNNSAHNTGELRIKESKENVRNEKVHETNNPKEPLKREKSKENIREPPTDNVKKETPSSAKTESEDSINEKPSTSKSDSK